MGLTVCGMASAVGRGLVAGLIGTVAITATTTLDMKLRNRPASEAPVEAVSKLLGLDFKDDESKKHFSNLVHWGYGAGWGVARGVLDELGVEGRVAALAHFAAVWGTALAMLPALGIAPPITEQPAEETAIDALHHLSYAFATDAAYEVITHH